MAGRPAQGAGWGVVMVALVLLVLLAFALVDLIGYSLLALGVFGAFIFAIYLLQPVFIVLGAILTVVMWALFAALVVAVAYRCSRGSGDCGAAAPRQANP